MSSSIPTHFTLNTGAKIPAVGLGKWIFFHLSSNTDTVGTWKSEPGVVRQAVAFALKDGYRHIDAALIYGNEHEVGQGIKDSGIPREEIFITGKLWNTHHPDAAAGLQMTLDALGTDYLDLYVSVFTRIVKILLTLLAHSLACSPCSCESSCLINCTPLTRQNGSHELLPVNPDGSRSVDKSWDQAKTWKQMEDLYKSGKVKAIGLANWSVPYLKELEESWKVVPAVNQVELHPFLPQHELREHCKKLGILMEAYSPLGSTGESHNQVAGATA
jgi:glycerol 2-dehydrogenase (NADP+)